MKNLVLILVVSVNPGILLGQPAEVGIIDFYGTAANTSAITKCLPFKVNDSLTFLTSEDAYLNTKKEIIDCLLKQPGAKEADIYFICCTEDTRWMAFVGVGAKKAGTYLPAPVEDIKLRAEIKQAYDSLQDLNMTAVVKGEASEDDSTGHSLIAYLPAKQIQTRFVIYADKYLPELRSILKNSKYADHRAAAAAVMAYYHSKPAIVGDLLRAVKDPDEGVRNNAARAVGILAKYGQRHPDLKINIPADPFIDFINSISWTDRNKGAMVLFELTSSRDKEVLSKLRELALPAIVEMAKWKSMGHSTTSYYLLGRIAAWSDKEITEGMHNKEASIEAMQAKIKSTKHAPKR